MRNAPPFYCDPRPSRGEQGNAIGRNGRGAPRAEAPTTSASGSTPERLECRQLRGFEAKGLPIARPDVTRVEYCAHQTLRRVRHGSEEIVSEFSGLWPDWRGRRSERPRG